MKPEAFVMAGLVPAIPAVGQTATLEDFVAPSVQAFVGLLQTM